MKIKFKKRDSIMVSFFVLLLCLVNFSCEKFVDVKSTSATSLINTAEDCQLLLNDYDNMNRGYPSDGEMSADDYYLNDVSYTSTSLTETDRNIYIWSNNAIRDLALPQWQTPYKTIYLANLILESLDKIGDTTDPAKIGDMRGQALFFRSYAFWNLAQIYVRPFNTNTADQDLGIPIRLSSDINGKSTRGTARQTYNQIIEDLDNAAKLLNSSSNVASRPNKTAAYAMLARVYLSMNEYPKALENANLALNLYKDLIDFNSLSTSSNTPFVRFNKEVIFHSLGTQSAALNPNTGTNNIAKIPLDLINSYSSNDLRSVIFFKSNGTTGPNAGSFRFTGNYEPVTSSIFFIGLAVDELYLIRAECYARSENTNAALMDLNTLLKTRWKTGTFIDFAAANSAEALSLILVERRKELIMRGLRWTDLRRLNQDSRFAKTLSRTVSGDTFTLPPNDSRYTLLIPREVISNAGIVQNIR